MPVLGCVQWDAGATEDDRACGDDVEGEATAYYAWMSTLGGVSLTDWSCDGRDGATARTGVLSVYTTATWRDTGAHGDPCGLDVAGQHWYTSFTLRSDCPRDVVPEGVGWGLLP